jgi:hypothetical protein
MSYAVEIFIRFGVETGVAYTSGEFRGKDGWLREPVEVGIISRFINNIRRRRRVPEMIRQMCHLCLYRAQRTKSSRKSRQLAESPHLNHIVTRYFAIRSPMTLRQPSPQR